jgi:hypothetical protein
MNCNSTLFRRYSTYSCTSTVQYNTLVLYNTEYCTQATRWFVLVVSCFLELLFSGMGSKFLLLVSSNLAKGDKKIAKQGDKNN